VDVEVLVEQIGNTFDCHVIVNILPLYILFFFLFSFNLLPLSAQIAKRVIHLAGAVAGASGTNYLSRSGRN